MKQTIKGQRFYENEMSDNEFSMTVQAMRDFNYLVIIMYNLLYEKRYCPTSFKSRVADGNVTAYMKQTYGINDYYVTAITTQAAGMLSSQIELKRVHIKEQRQRIKKIKSKIKDEQDRLEKMQFIKSSLIQYYQYGHWEKPYPRCRLELIMDTWIQPFRQSPIPLNQYERELDQRIRNSKHKIKMLESRLGRNQTKLQKMYTNKPKRVVKGGKSLFKKKDTLGVSDQWRQEFMFARIRNVTISGRHTSKYGNYLCPYHVDTHQLDWRLPAFKGNSMETVHFNGFEVYRDQEQYESLFTCPQDQRIAIAYQFRLYIDGNNRPYIVPSVTYETNASCYRNYDYSTGCIAIDLNIDHIAYAELDGNGLPIQTGIVPMNLQNKTTNQAKQIIGDACARVAKLCDDTCKPLVMEDIDLSLKKSDALYEPAAKNRVASVFAYRRLDTAMQSQARKHGFVIRKVDPAYTSMLGKIKFMRLYGLSIHCAACIAIGQRGLDILNANDLPICYTNLIKHESKCTPLAQLYKLVKPYNKHLFYRTFPIFKNKTAFKKYMSQWA